MAKKKSSNGGCLAGIILILIQIILLPIKAVKYIIESIFKALKKARNAKAFDNKIEQTQNKFRRDEELRMEEHYTRQLDESLRIINETNNISTLFARLAFLDQLKRNVIQNNDGLDLRNVVEAINTEIARKYEYIDLFIVRRVTALEIQCENSKPATTSNKFKTLYNQFETHKEKMCDYNISTYTNLCQKHIID